MKSLFAVLIAGPLLACASETNRWFERDVPFTPSSLTYGNGMWWGFANARYTSTDGLTWIQRQDIQNDVKPEFVRGEFYFLDNPIYASPDGWSNFRLVGKPFDGAWIHAFAYGNDQFYALRLPDLGISADGANWSYIALPLLNGDLKHFAAGAGSVVITTTAGAVYTLSEGTWSENHFPFSFSVMKATPAGFLALQNLRSPSGTYSCFLHHSSDGIEWTVVQEKPGHADRIVPGGGNVVIWGQDVFAMVTPDGKNWRDITRPTNRLIDDLAYGGGRFLGVLRYGAMISSSPFHQPRINSITRTETKIFLQTDTTNSFIIEKTTALGSAWTEIPNPNFRTGGVEFDEASTGNVFFRLKTAGDAP